MNTRISRPAIEWRIGGVIAKLRRHQLDLARAGRVLESARYARRVQRIERLARLAVTRFAY